MGEGSGFARGASGTGRRSGSASGRGTATTRFGENELEGAVIALEYDTVGVNGDQPPSVRSAFAGEQRVTLAAGRFEEGEAALGTEAGGETDEDERWRGGGLSVSGDGSSGGISGALHDACRHCAGIPDMAGHRDNRR